MKNVCLFFFSMSALVSPLSYSRKGSSQTSRSMGAESFCGSVSFFQNMILLMVNEEVEYNTKHYYIYK